MDVTARTDDGKVMAVATREYREVGLDLNGIERLGAWQIKEVLDMSLQPGRNTDERFVVEFPAGTKRADIEVALKYSVSAAHEMEVHRVVKTVRFVK